MPILNTIIRSGPIAHRIMAVVILCLFLAANAPAHSGSGPGIECYTCRDTGLVPCEDHGASQKWCKAHSFFCSECRETLSCCRGRGMTPCRCVDHDWENLIEEPGYELFQGSIDAQAGLVDYMRIEPIFAVTEHFVIVSTLDELKLTPGEVAERSHEFNELKRAFPWLFRNCQTLSPHAMIHLYALRLDRIYKKYAEAFGMSPDEDRAVPYSSNHVVVYLVSENKQQAAWQARHNGAALVSGAGGTYCISNKGGAKGGRHMKASGVNLSGDTNFHDGVIHLTSRCLLERFFCRKGGKFPPGWLKVGFSHWMEWEILEQCSYYLTNIEVKGLAEEWISQGWGKRARSLARRASGDVISFALLSKRDFADLGYREHVLSWSYLDFILKSEDGPNRFREYCNSMRARVTPRDALLDAFDWSELTLENRWRRKLLMAPDEYEGMTRSERFVTEFDRSLGHPDLETRASAAYFLKFCDDLPAAERVIKAFQEGDLLVRASALEALKTFANAAAVRFVVENGLTHASAAVRRNTAVAMGQFPGLMELTTPLLVKLLGDQKAPVRAGAVRALGELHPDEAYLPMSALAGDKDPEVRVELALALWHYSRDEALTDTFTLLRDKVWAVRLAAVRALHNVRDKRVIPTLIDQLGREGGRLREDIRDLLVKLTGQDFNIDSERWQWWWNNYGGDKFQFGGAPSKSQQHKMRYAIQYHDVETCSKKFIFLLDTSSSMNEIIRVEKLGGKTYGKGDLSKRKIYAAQAELVRLLRTFDKNIFFNIITFHDEIGLWRKNVASAKKDTRKSAEKFVWAIDPPKKASTNIYDALIAAFDMVDAGFAKRKYESVVDTMFFLSDGNPTAGPVTDVDMILRTVKERNRIHGIKIHTFNLGGPSTETYFLRKLAESTGGAYQEIRVR